MFYALGVMKLFRWDFALKEKMTYVTYGLFSTLIPPWMIYRSYLLQETDKKQWDPIVASLYYFWLVVPEIALLFYAFF